MLSTSLILADNIRQLFVRVDAKYNNYSTEGTQNVGVATAQHRDIWSSFMLIPKLRVTGELAVCKLIDLFCGEKHLLAWRQHCMTPVSCCEPELLNLYSATLCRVDLPASIYACSRVSAQNCVVLHCNGLWCSWWGGELKTKARVLIFSETLLLAVSTCSTCELLMTVFNFCYSLTCWVSNYNFNYCSWWTCDVWWRFEWGWWFTMLRSTYSNGD